MKSETDFFRKRLFRKLQKSSEFLIIDHDSPKAQMICPLIRFQSHIA